MSGASAGYQPHIDGIRAIAIALVLLFHFGLGGASQGFLGVDVFFVISGFLVGGMIFRDQDIGAFSLLQFFRRRIARIVPALLVTAVLVLIAGYFLLLPDEWMATAAGVRAALLITANRHFYLNQDYFGPGKLEMHFLHSWSLSVEEQFYLVFPLLALALMRFRRYRTWLLLLATIGSVAAFAYVRQSNPSAAFYYMPLRAWELLAGATLASAIQSSSSNMAFRGFGFAGLLLTVAPAFASPLLPTISATLWQMLCVAGTACLLVASRTGTNDRVVTLLSALPFRALGLISYSLYLVHWPIMTLSQTWKILPLTVLERGGLLVASIAIAAASWKWIEMPCRRWINGAKLPDFAMIGTMLALLAIPVMLATTILQKQGFPDRLPQQATQYLAQAKNFSPLREKCHSNEMDRPVEPNAACIIGNPARPAEIALWGDSHGVELSWELGQALRARGQALVQLSSSSCPPLLDVSLPNTPPCEARNRKVLSYLVDNRAIETVVLAAFYTGYDEVERAAFLRGFALTVEQLRRAGKYVIIVGPIPRPLFKVPAGMARQILQGRVKLVDGHLRKSHDADSLAIWNALAPLERPGQVVLFDPAPSLCERRQCRYHLGNNVLFFDDNHVSLNGAKRIATEIIRLLPAPSSAAP